MKITKSQLKQIIKEELENVLMENPFRAEPATRPTDGAPEPRPPGAETASQEIIKLAQKLADEDGWGSRLITDKEASNWIPHYVRIRNAYLLTAKAIIHDGKSMDYRIEPAGLNVP